MNSDHITFKQSLSVKEHSLVNGEESLPTCFGGILVLFPYAVSLYGLSGCEEN